jgi:hypothetical protein
VVNQEADDGSTTPNDDARNVQVVPLDDQQQPAVQLPVQGTTGSTTRVSRIPSPSTRRYSPDRSRGRRGSTKRRAKANRKFFGNEWVNYQSTCPSGRKQKIKTSILNNVFLQTLNWQKTVDDDISYDLMRIIGANDYHVDHENMTVELSHPYELSARANSEDKSLMGGSSKWSGLRRILEGNGKRV